MRIRSLKAYSLQFVELGLIPLSSHTNTYLNGIYNLLCSAHNRSNVENKILKLSLLRHNSFPSSVGKDVQKADHEMAEHELLSTAERARPLFGW